MIEELLPGLVGWSAFHKGIERTVHSVFELSSGTLIDPMEPEEGLGAIEQVGEPKRIVLTNRHHYRHSARYAKRFTCPVLCHEAGLPHFDADRTVQGFSFDEQLADGVRALELASICAEETTVLLDLADGALVFGDGLTRAEDGSLKFMPDSLLGDDSESVRAGLSKHMQRMLEEEDFEALLFAHATPVLGGGQGLLADFLSTLPQRMTAPP